MFDMKNRDVEYKLKAINLLKETIKNMEVIVEHWKNIRKNLREWANERAAFLEERIENRESPEILQIYLSEAEAANGLVALYEKEYSLALQKKLALESGLERLEKNYGIDSSLVEDSNDNLN